MPEIASPTFAGGVQPPSAAYGYPRVRAAVGQNVVPPVEAWKMVNKRGFYPSILGLEKGFPPTVAGLATAVPGEGVPARELGMGGAYPPVKRGATTFTPGAFTFAPGAFSRTPGAYSYTPGSYSGSLPGVISRATGAKPSRLRGLGAGWVAAGKRADGTFVDAQGRTFEQAQGMAKSVPSGGGSIFGDILGFIPGTLNAGLNIAQAVPDLMDAFDDPTRAANRKASLQCASAGGTWTGQTCDLNARYAAQSSANDWAKSLLPIAGILGGAYVLGKVFG